MTTGDLNAVELIGLWDLRTEPLTIGGWLDLAVELRCHATEDADTTFAVCFIWDKAHPLPAGVSSAGSSGMRPLTPEDLGGSVVVSTMMEFDGMANCYSASSLSAVREFVEAGEGRYATWPVLGIDGGRLDHEYPSTLNIQAYFKKNGFIPHPELNRASIARAREILIQISDGRVPVIVHLKVDPRGQGNDNADIAVWTDFMSRRPGDGEVVFVVIGNDDVGSLRDLPDVVLTQDFENDLARDLALVQIGPAFMGTASGPAHGAILGEQPYAIFKPMYVHTEHMRREIGDLPGFPFATPDQHLVRFDPTVDDLVAAFETIRPKGSVHTA